MSTLFLCDPVCALPYGHNVAALANIKMLMGTYFDNSVCLGSTLLRSDIATKFTIEQFYKFYYSDLMDVCALEKEHGQICPSGHIERRESALFDVHKFLNRWSVGSDDVLCYPSIDFYSIEALTGSISTLQKIKPRRLLLRFIGVMEGASQAYRNTERAMLANICALLSSGINVKLAAETPKYAERLSAELGTTVTVVPSVENCDLMPLPEHDVFNVLAPGSARGDKGFFLLESIFREIRRRTDDLKIRFTCQSLPDNDFRSQMVYCSKLYSIPGVTLLPAAISSEQMVELYRNCDLVLMPYAADVYEFRGSAVLAEAAYYGRPVITFDGIGFADQVRFFRLGSVCADVNEMIASIMAHSAANRIKRESNVQQARYRYVSDATASYAEWFR